jgi:hypothetical protein
MDQHVRTGVRPVRYGLATVLRVGEELGDKAAAGNWNDEMVEYEDGSVTRASAR